ncbi:carboxypeptidase-like regulatory domain-containing protein [Filimonas effusa]|uniref:SusC/RagA family TonB-linked outer membrane protein n=1 Tax=Filimonas effusa TaxID=2508721 RepID=A0A4Q1D2H0_9BACT|nr:carboxypeptidase-like regulatory domain-containing protein [Filimonas effusa]RXK81417.1 hypothetical protein ESB13_21015 [Filimonas effusa]
MSTLCLLRGKVLYLLFLATTLCLHNNAQAGPGAPMQDISTTVIKLSKNIFTLSTLFTTIETQANVRFAYDTKELNVNEQIEISAKKIELKQLLTEVSKQSGATFEWSKNTVTVIPPQKKLAEETQFLAAQTVVTGKIVDKSGQPVIKAAVIVKGTGIGTTSDEKGNFRINAKPGDVLEISFVGYQTEEVKVTGDNVLTVVLTELKSSLADVVVVGYGTQKKANLTGAVGVTWKAVPLPTVARRYKERFPVCMPCRVRVNPVMMALL